MWWVVLNVNEWHNLASFDFFDDPKSEANPYLLVKLKKHLKTFIESEQFEKAIFIRDQIRDLKSDRGD